MTVYTDAETKRFGTGCMAPPLIDFRYRASTLWVAASKGDMRTRAMADNHYTRQTPGSPSWTRPGYNYVLLHEAEDGSALFCWWRPKWEDGRPGTKRKDGLRVIECTMFRREGRTILSSLLINDAVDCLCSPEARQALHLDNAGRIDGLITGVGSTKTTRCRSDRSKPGACFRHAGWTEFYKNTKSKADVWLEHFWINPWH